MNESNTKLAQIISALMWLPTASGLPRLSLTSLLWWPHWTFGLMDALLLFHVMQETFAHSIEGSTPSEIISYPVHLMLS